MASSQSIRRGQFPSVCHLCKTDPNIQFKCCDCLLLMCQKCRDKIHAKIKNSERHKIVDIKDIGNDCGMDFTNLECKDHSAFCCLFCKSCDQLVCATCLAKGHKSHDFTEINEGYLQKLDKVKQFEECAEENVGNLKSIQGNLEQFKSLQNDKMATEEKKLENHRKALKKAVDVHINKLISDLKSSNEEIQAAVDEDIKTIQQTEEDAQAKLHGLSELINTNDSNKFFSDVHVSKMGKSQDINIPQTPSILMSIPRFVPKDINIADIGELQRDSDAASNKDKINLQIIKQYQSQLNTIPYTCPCSVGSLWIGNSEYKKVQRVRPNNDKLQVISTVNTIVLGMASTESGDLLISSGGTRLQQIGCKSGQVSDTQYDMAPLIATAVHITHEGKVLVGGNKDKLNRRAVIVMDRDGRHERTYEHDKQGKHLFTYPRSITSTKSGNIHVTDRRGTYDRGRLVVLSQGGELINIYSGPPSVNKVRPFYPSSIATTPGDNVMVVERYQSDSLHLLDNTGHLLTIIDAHDSGIKYPYSLAFTSSGSLWIGCSTNVNHAAKDAKLYHVKFSEPK